MQGGELDASMQLLKSMIGERDMLDWYQRCDPAS